MRETTKLIGMSLLIVGIWYGIGYVHGYTAGEQAARWEAYQGDVQPVPTQTSQTAANGRDLSGIPREEGTESQTAA